MTPPTYEQEFVIRYFEIDKHQEATPSAVLTLLEETAASHCLAIGHGLCDLLEQGIGWVLLSGFYRMERYPKYHERITIRTWISGYTKTSAIRENLILDDQGAVIGSATGVWVFFNIKRRRPVAIPESIRNLWGRFPQRSTHKDVRKSIEAIDSAKFQASFVVSRCDLDTNDHLNNVRYLQWLLETMPCDIRDSQFLHSIDGRFISEAHYGDRIESLTDPDSREASYLHTIKETRSNRACAVARTVWKGRRQG